MVPKIANAGDSFVAARGYYLGQGRVPVAGGINEYTLGKQGGRGEGSRVAFAVTRNLLTDDAQHGFQAMQASLDRYREIRAGKKGRPLQFPVYSYSLSWAIEEEPSQEQMLVAADETLLALGLKGHQAVIVSHNDKAYSHVHIIANRLKPDLSGTANMVRDQLTLSSWSEDYERRHGPIFCEQRVANNELRRNGQFAVDQVSKPRVIIEGERRGLKPVVDAFLKKQKQILQAASSGQSGDVLDVKMNVLRAVFRIMKFRVDMTVEAASAEHRPGWSDLYKRQTGEMKSLRACSGRVLLAAEVDRLSRHWAVSGLQDAEIVQLRSSKSEASKALSTAHRAERRILGATMRRACHAAIDELWQEFWPTIEKSLNDVNAARVEDGRIYYPDDTANADENLELSVGEAESESMKKAEALSKAAALDRIPKPHLPRAVLEGKPTADWRRGLLTSWRESWRAAKEKADEFAAQAAKLATEQARREQTAPTEADLTEARAWYAAGGVRRVIAAMGRVNIDNARARIAAYGVTPQQLGQVVQIEQVLKNCTDAELSADRSLFDDAMTLSKAFRRGPHVLDDGAGALELEYEAARPVSRLQGHFDRLLDWGGRLMRKWREKRELEAAPKPVAAPQEAPTAPQARSAGVRRHEASVLLQEALGGFASEKERIGAMADSVRADLVRAGDSTLPKKDRQIAFAAAERGEKEVALAWAAIFRTDGTGLACQLAVRLDGLGDFATASLAKFETALKDAPARILALADDLARARPRVEAELFVDIRQAQELETVPSRGPTLGT